MKVLKNIADLKKWRAEQVDDLGFVPTMGALHQGHLSLVERAQEECTSVLVSIFVNPTQFNNSEDLQKYPSSIDSDLKKLEALDTDAVFIPHHSEIYKDNFRFKVCEQEESLKLCGQNRPGHFTGVLTVLLKLFNLTKARKAYFGEKDYQQLRLVMDFAEAMFMDLDIIAVPTVREESGLAMSSRNQRLDKKARSQADKFAQIFGDDQLSLQEMRDKFIQNGIEIDYLETHEKRRFAAVWIGGVRLIDNRPNKESHKNSIQPAERSMS